MSTDQRSFMISPVGVLDTDGPFLLLLDVSLPDANKQRHQEEEPQHTGADLHDLHVADHGRNLEGLRISQDLVVGLGASTGCWVSSGRPEAAGRSGRCHQLLYRRSLQDTDWTNTRPPRCGTCKTSMHHCERLDSNRWFPLTGTNPDFMVTSTQNNVSGELEPLMPTSTSAVAMATGVAVALCVHFITIKRLIGKVALSLESLVVSEVLSALLYCEEDF